MRAGGISLFVLTPRAGRSGHRYLVSPGCPLSDSKLGYFVSRARLKPVGSNYIAARHEVSQPKTGRRGDEVDTLVRRARG